jgi:2-dehydro-3-deoxyphosphogluconate aldolase/(4S)-4-hydroxy-2-oxoglutarate aldolase
MRSKQEIMSRLENPGVIAVIRAPSGDLVSPACAALVEGGIIALELTMTTPGALEVVGQVAKEFGDRAVIGIGTILDADTCKAAYDAGAEFAVTPVCRGEFVAIAKKANRPIMLGAYSPTEAQTAHEAGADYVKIFPGDVLGPNYIKGLLAPLPHLRIVPTGEIQSGSVGDFFRAGVVAMGMGGTLVSREILEKRDWVALTARARSFVEAAAAFRKETKTT